MMDVDGYDKIDIFKYIKKLEKSASGIYIFSNYQIT